MREARIDRPKRGWLMQIKDPGNVCPRGYQLVKEGNLTPFGRDAT